MTYDLSILDRSGAGLAPDRDLFADWRDPLYNRLAAAARAEGLPQWRRTGRWQCSYGFLGEVVAWCAPVLDAELAEPPLPMPRADDESYWDAYPDERVAHPLWPQMRAYFGLRSPQRHQVPAFKFSSSDAWYFDRDECFTLGYHLSASPDPELRDLGAYFLFAHRHGGCTTS